MPIEMTPFSFEEDTNLVDINTLPAATSKAESQEESKETPPTSTKQAPSQAAAIDINEQENEEDDFEPVYDILGKPIVQEQKKEETPTSVEDSFDYKQFTKYLIEKGTWEDFEGSDEIDLNAESFAELGQAQAKRQIEKAKIEERESRDVTTNQLIDFVSSGGKMDDLLANIKEQRDIESISIEEVDGQEEAVRMYYESLDRDKRWIDKHISKLKDDDELADEAKFSKDKLVEVYQTERESIVKEQQEIAKDRQLREQAFIKAVKSQIYSDKDLVDRDKKEFDKFVYDYKYQDESGNKYSEFGKQFLEIQNDPKKYYKFQKMIKNFDAYEEKTKTENKAKAEVFSFIKKNAETTAGIMGELPQKENKKEKVLAPFRFNK